MPGPVHPPVAVWYHAWLPTDQALKVVTGQMMALAASGLGKAATEIHAGVDGDETDAIVLSAMMPAHADCRANAQGSEYGTLSRLQQWLPGHEDWAVCYHHAKGVSHGDDGYGRWRQCLENNVIWQWQRCVADLQRGYDTVGAHWTLNLDQQYWAGTFWWATGRHLLQLRTLDPKTVNGKSYEAEVWIGQCGYRPKIRDYATHRLMAGC